MQVCLVIARPCVLSPELEKINGECMSKHEYVRITDHTETHMLPRFRTLNICHIGILDYVVVEVTLKAALTHLWTLLWKGKEMVRQTLRALTRYDGPCCHSKHYLVTHIHWRCLREDPK